MEVEIGTIPQGRMTFELYADAVPRTCQNFQKLLTGERGMSKDPDDPVFLHMEGSLFHRIIPGFMAQGGDFTLHDGTGGESIYGRTFPDENFTRKHTGKGILSMANAGPNTNGSQFFLCFAPFPHLDGMHTVFGKVSEGLEVLDEMEKVGSRTGDVRVPVFISDCGEI